MKLIISDRVIIFYNEAVKLPDNMLLLLEAMHRFNLDSCSPLEPVHHGPEGYYESNAVYFVPANTVRNLLVVNRELAEPFLGLPNLKKITELAGSFRHGLVCNVILTV